MSAFAIIAASASISCETGSLCQPQLELRGRLRDHFRSAQTYFFFALTCHLTNVASKGRSLRMERDDQPRYYAVCSPEGCFVTRDASVIRNSKCVSFNLTLFSSSALSLRAVKGLSMADNPGYASEAQALNKINQWRRTMLPRAFQLWRENQLKQQMERLRVNNREPHRFAERIGRQRSAWYQKGPVQKYADF